ncbi:DUF2141 domain-containing protein [Rhodopirellula sp. P2]|uniref:DUF2141 domain-containing protein n=1 Tax=Rhodopirellula sp. P2 TaxID=2127060 RepID=UPI0023688863|nr:DUF2141 domain-containing protein [Rhodopirellula sp. P2]WDQ18964.1 DUF2141 domain-containing protein [Rhodopirellula sp. P2]
MENGFEPQAEIKSDPIEQVELEPSWNAWQSLPERWQQNHGSLLMAFATLVFLTGIGVLTYRQNQFRPPAFPDASSINPAHNNALTALDLATGEAANATEERVLIRVIGAIPSDSLVWLALYNADTSFNDPENALVAAQLPIQPNGVAACTIPISQLPKRFAIAAFHDTDNDGALSRNQFGIPAERYGFSNNARGKFGPPDFEEAVIDRPENGETPIDVEIY